jgi:hypothetical protein
VVRLSGFPAWITWLVVHLFYLVGFQNRLLVLIRWAFSFVTRGRGARIISSEGHERKLDEMAGAPAGPALVPERPGDRLDAARETAESRPVPRA